MPGKQSGKRTLIGFGLALLVVVVVLSMRYLQSSHLEEAGLRPIKGPQQAPVLLKEFSDYQ